MKNRSDINRRKTDNSKRIMHGRTGNGEIKSDKNSIANENGQAFTAADKKRRYISDNDRNSDGQMLLSTDTEFNMYMTSLSYINSSVILLWRADFFVLRAASACIAIFCL